MCLVLNDFDSPLSDKAINMGLQRFMTARLERPHPYIASDHPNRIYCLSEVSTHRGKNNAVQTFERWIDPTFLGTTPNAVSHV